MEASVNLQKRGGSCADTPFGVNLHVVYSVVSVVTFAGSPDPSLIAEAMNIKITHACSILIMFVQVNYVLGSLLVQQVCVRIFLSYLLEYGSFADHGVM